jgi:hypothetical protein
MICSNKVSEPCMVLTKQKDALQGLEQGVSRMALETLIPPRMKNKIQWNEFFSVYVPQLLVFVDFPAFCSNPKLGENFCT